MRLRLMVYFAIVVLVTITSMLLVAAFGLRNEVRSYMFRGGMYRTSGLVEQLQDYYQANGSWQGASSFFNSRAPGHAWGNPGAGQMMGGMMRQHLVLTDAQGRIVADSSASTPSGEIGEQELREALPIEAGNNIVGYLVADGGIVFSADDETFLVGRLTRAAWIAGLVAGLIALLLATYLAYRLLKPVQALTQAAQQLGQGDLQHRAPVQGNDELAGLSRTFNRMADSLEQAEQSRKALTADIAHELRTPLAVQRANLEAMQDGIYPPSKENLDTILEQNTLLTRLVEDLNTLALADSGKLELVCAVTDFEELVNRVLERFRSQAELAGIQIMRLPGSPGKEIHSMFIDALRVEQIIGNLLSNAIRYTENNGSIEVSLETRQDKAVLTVHDSGEGIPEEALPHVFERFYRADHSRSRSSGGSGLGLAIARKLAEAHSGDLQAENHPSGGALFTLTLPLYTD